MFVYIPDPESHGYKQVHIRINTHILGRVGDFKTSLAFDCSSVISGKTRGILLCVTTPSLGLLLCNLILGIQSSDAGGEHLMMSTVVAPPMSRPSQLKGGGVSQHPPRHPPPPGASFLYAPSQYCSLPHPLILEKLGAFSPVLCCTVTWP